VRHEVARGKATWILPREGRPGYTAGRPIPDSVKERIAASLYTPIYLIDAKSGQVVKVFGKIAAAREVGVCKATLYYYCKSGKINKIGIYLKKPE
jgi:hypothetical protein